MEPFKQIVNYIEQLQTLDKKWEELLYTMNTAFKKY